ncbi:MAG: hypothetical protein ACI9DF_004029, partial [Verrucomicrobiales bacterium]
HRVESHIFISVLGYHLLSWVRLHLEKAGDPREWKTVRRLLSTHSLVSTRLPLKDGRIVTVRKPRLPDAEQSRVYQLLGIDWKRACPAVKSELKGATTLSCLCGTSPCFIGRDAGHKKLGLTSPAMLATHFIAP